ncbi:MAG: hypothetical protein ACJATA_001503 [Sphingobacteriales bacterium]|jgi:hypothetical protein
MKWLVPLGFILLFTQKISAQKADTLNLIPNGDFEEVTIPKKLGPFCKALPKIWQFSDADILSPNFDKRCTMRIPDSMRINGDYSAGLWLFNVDEYENPTEDPYREYLHVELKQPLIKGQNYALSLYVAPHAAAIFAINSLGFLFTNETTYSENALINSGISRAPQLIFPFIMSENGEWILHEFRLTATDTFKHLTIGNFFNNQKTQHKRIDPLNPKRNWEGGYSN